MLIVIMMVMEKMTRMMPMIVMMVMLLLIIMKMIAGLHADDVDVYMEVYVYIYIYKYVQEIYYIYHSYMKLGVSSLCLQQDNRSVSFVRANGITPPL